MTLTELCNWSAEIFIKHALKKKVVASWRWDEWRRLVKKGLGWNHSMFWGQLCKWVGENGWGGKRASEFFFNAQHKSYLTSSLVFLLLALWRIRCERKICLRYTQLCILTQIVWFVAYLVKVLILWILSLYKVIRFCLTQIG